MFKHNFYRPLGKIKIPWPSGICFEEVPGVVVEMAKEAGETAAKVEQVQEEQKEQSEKVEGLEQRQRWNDETLDRTFERIWALEARIDELQSRIDILEAGEEEPEPNPEPAADPEPAATVIEPKVEPVPDKKEKAKTSWGMW